MYQKVRTMLRCDCCGRDFQTAAAWCHLCVSWVYCSCGQRFCACHQVHLYDAHKKTCPSLGAPFQIQRLHTP